MKKFLVLITYAAMLITFSCDNNSDIPIEPYIEFRDLAFIKGYTTDSLKLSLRFRDGDMDLGLSPYDYDDPYHPVNFFLKDGSGNLTLLSTKMKYENWHLFASLKPGQTGKLVTYHNGENQVPYECPFSRTQYIYDSLFIEGKDAHIVDASVHNIVDVPEEMDNLDVLVLLDTLYYEYNVNHNNIDVEFLVQNNDDSFSEFNWKEQFCLHRDFNQRFPLIDGLKLGSEIKDGPFVIEGLSGKSGILTYSMTSIGFQYVLKGKKIKLRVTIRDRALHVSNTIETAVVQL